MQTKHLLGHRLQVRFSSSALAWLQAFSDAEGLSLAGAIRVLVDSAAQGNRGADDGAVPLAALVASEHVLQLLQTIVPEGSRRCAELAPSAITAAEERLARLSGQRREDHQ